MLRQALVTPSRALRSATRSIAQRPFSLPQNFVAPIAVRRIQPASARWYSEATKDSNEAENKEGNAEAESKGNAEPAEDAAVVELKKKLETKDKEAADWKVGRVHRNDTSG